MAKKIDPLTASSGSAGWWWWNAKKKIPCSSPPLVVDVEEDPQTASISGFVLIVLFCFELVCIGLV
jgi:hypothetical protein